MAQIESAMTQERHDAQAALAHIQRFPLDTPEQRDQAGRLINLAKDKIQELETQRKSVTDPLNGTIKTVNGWFKPVREFYEACQVSLKQRLADRLRELAAEQQAALATVQELGGHATAETFAVAHATPSAPSAVQTREVWKFEVVDFKRLPDEYKMADESKIRKVVQAMKGDCDIPGIRIEPELVIVSGRT